MNIQKILVECVMKKFNIPKNEFEDPKTLKDCETKLTDKGKTDRNSQDQTTDIVSVMTLTGIL